MAGGYHVDDVEEFNAAGSGADNAASMVRGAGLRAAVSSGANGIEGTRIAAALDRLATMMEQNAESYATSVEDTAQRARDTGDAYREVDAIVEAAFKKALR